ncbi:coiled-coil domain-containing protein 122 [Ambystoma mexicanum]|uniref:coiled-coil domain-containing protein 122 n=1 Tax=Ambystoma mexicanum TaxID=8296 RepID=UPI0037E7A824
MIISVELKKTEKDIFQNEDEIETANLTCVNLATHNQSLYAQIVKLKYKIKMQTEDLEILLARNNMYREKIASHKQLFSEAEKKLTIVTDLLEKRNEVYELRRRKEELICDLENPEGNTIKQVQGEISDLNGKITAIKQSMSDNSVLLEKEKEKHSKFRKEIEVQNKRYDAILKRLHCQLNKVQLSNRQRKWSIEQMEKTIADLKKCLGMTE